MVITIFHRYRKTDDQVARLVPASFRERLMAQLIDGILLGIIIGLVLAVISGGRLFSVWVSPMMPVYLVQKTAGFSADPSYWWWGGYFINLSLPVVADIYLSVPAPLHLLIYGIYYGVFHARSGQTPGKMMKGLVVVTGEGDRISLPVALSRWVFYLISIVPLGWGLWVSAFRDDKLTWHDLMLGTRVYRFIDLENPS